MSVKYRAHSFARGFDLTAWLNANKRSISDFVFTYMNSSGYIDLIEEYAESSGDYTRDVGTISADSLVLQINVVALAKTFTRLSGSFLTDGFKVGDRVTFSGFLNAGNNGTFVISTVTALVITCTTASGLVNETGSGGERAVATGYQVILADGGRVDGIRIAAGPSSATVNVLGAGTQAIPAGTVFEVKAVNYVGTGLDASDNKVVVTGVGANYRIDTSLRG